MANSHFCLSSNTYKNHVFEGFSRLQQSDEFVDMTLATGDQFVKVHKTLIALASPYLKALLQTIPCQHPVLFLSNVNHEELQFILEYIYTGEVNIPPKNLESFLDTARAMHISGLESIVIPSENHTNDKPTTNEKQTSQVEPAPLQVFRSTKNRFPAVKANITINENDFNLQVEPQVEPNTHIPSTQNDSGNDIPLLDFNIEPAPKENFGVLNTCIGTNNITINLRNDDDNANNANQNLDILNYVGITKNPITRENIDNIPIVIDEMPQNLQRPFLNIGKAAFTITADTALNNSKNDITVDNSSINNPTSFSNFFNIVSKPLVAETNVSENDINNLPCGDIATQKTITESNAVNQAPANEAVEVDKDKDSLLYTISNRGSLQLITNRFMYYCHYTKDAGRRRRWRCIEYRYSHCPAAIDTDGETIVDRKHKHSHPNHSEKIWKKVVKSRVFSSLRMAQDVVKEKQSLPKFVPEEAVMSE